MKLYLSEIPLLTSCYHGYRKKEKADVDKMNTDSAVKNFFKDQASFDAQMSREQVDRSHDQISRIDRCSVKMLLYGLIMCTSVHFALILLYL